MYAVHSRVWPVTTNYRHSPIPVLGISILHTRLGLCWGRDTGGFVVQASQLASFVTGDLESVFGRFELRSRACTIGMDMQIHRCVCSRGV